MSEVRFSARRAVILGFGGLGVLLAGLAGWGAFASIAGAVIATGQVAVESRNQAVEHIDGGTVSEVPARDGDTVEQGDVLLRFSASLLRSEEAILKARYVEFAARRNRLEAEYRGRDAISWDPGLTALAEEDPKFRDAMTGQERLFRARRAASAGEAARLRERIGQTHGEIQGLEVQAVALGHQSKLIARELEAQRQLYKKGLTRISPVLALERAARGLEGTAGAIAADIARARGRIAEYEIAILQIDAKRIEKAEEEARQAKAGENEVLEQLASVRDRLGRREVRAPVSGTVFGATVFAPGEVVRPGEPIMQIVPRDSGLIVIARIAPIYVDQVYPGQEAVLRFSAFQMHQT
ncbi:MAG: HlyD family type I secretion periplasmic adaptor subunit, partial [Alphaproteobacteria bacterium]|nr:HlyD family type I secretion periplasmic adaptor subunit [Alphaproteobacteria bacterium]